MAGPSHSTRESHISEVSLSYDGSHMSGGLCRELGGGLCKYVDEMGSVCYDKAQVSIHPMELHYKDEDGYMKILSFVGLSCIIAHPVSSTFAFLKAMMLELHQTMPLLNTIHFVTDCQSSQYRNSSIHALVGQAQLTSTPNNEGKHYFDIWYTTFQLS